MAAVNFITYEGIDLIATALGTGISGVNMVYIEFENTAGSPTVPSEDRADGAAYYKALGSPKDYLRVPVLTSPAYSASSAVYSGNKLTLLASAADGVGENGLTFSAASNSKVYGAALVFASDEDDNTDDIVLSRHYFATEKAKSSVDDLVVNLTVELM